MRLILATLGLISLNLAYASDNVYQYTDKNGMTVYTNKPVKNSKKLDLPALSVYAAPVTLNDYSAKGYTAKAKNNTNTPKVYVKNTQTFGTNEVGRTQILHEELSKEKQALSDSQQALQQAQKTKLASEQNNPDLYQQRLQALRDAVTEHQKNIDILSKQLGVTN